MNLTDKGNYKSTFKKELDKFANKLEKYVSSDNGDWTVKGFIDVYKNILQKIKPLLDDLITNLKFSLSDKIYNAALQKADE